MHTTVAPVHTTLFVAVTGDVARCTVAPASDGWWGVYFSAKAEHSVRYYEGRRAAMRQATLVADRLRAQGWSRGRSEFVLHGA